MEAYTSFAAVYDTFMDNVPYEEWSEYLHGLLIENGISDGIVLDLGCGTGTMTELLSGFGYDMIGVDNSEEMLGIAAEKRLASGNDILYLLQDMRELELYGTVSAAVSVCDSLNYVTESEDLVQVFERVREYLEPGGVFIFDFNTEYKYREILGDQTIAEDREECSFIWDNYYYEEEHINEYELSLFIKDETASNEREEIYRKYHETHYQRAYTLEEMQKLAESAGFQVAAAYDAFTREAPTEMSERVYVVCRAGE